MITLRLAPDAVNGALYPGTFVDQIAHAAPEPGHAIVAVYNRLGPDWDGQVIRAARSEIERRQPRRGRFCLKREESQAAGDRQLAPEPSTERRRGAVLACAYCGRAITTGAARIEVNGLHAHNLANPEGIQYRVGCFADAGGLVVVGPRSTYWTWFAGYSWQVELCAGCRQQLGWYFRSADGVFHGLILDRLVEVEEGTPH